ncbi:5-oxoprolinase subunit B family protein [Streptomyces gilvosporeus]|uniref:Allophanate hydrolase n=1 Tax=Streptomyces gilvosporeus TaxID=553510 RepID=A0A1V0TKX9_9ACTN|nr:allophanate hydrolase subunit 1 [Streptomyces gilvosporeus]ARF53312.1 allophanate hydrolase [Streptomyces gilvosporeus]
MRALLTAGSRAVLVELDTLEEVIQVHESLRLDRPVGCVDLVPAARTLLISFDPDRTTRKALADDLSSRTGATHRSPQPRVVEIPVVYDGTDLAEVARLSGLTVGEVVRRHGTARYTVAFCGFAPGFAYLSGLDPALHLPRRPVPRTRVAPGSVAIADQFASVYPRASPGGWHLLGRTSAELWSIERQPPSLLTPGTQVRFIQVTS